MIRKGAASLARYCGLVFVHPEPVEDTRASQPFCEIIKGELLGKFLGVGAGEGARIPSGRLYDEFLPSLDRKEEQALEETVAEMIREGIIEYVPGAKPTCRLTKKGADLLC